MFNHADFPNPSAISTSRTFCTLLWHDCFPTHMDKKLPSYFSPWAVHIKLTDRSAEQKRLGLRNGQKYLTLTLDSFSEFTIIVWYSPLLLISVPFLIFSHHQATSIPIVVPKHKRHSRHCQSWKNDYANWLWSLHSHLNTVLNIMTIRDAIVTVIEWEDDSQ